MAVGDLLAWARPWRRTKTPGITVRDLGQGMAELVLMPVDGPPMKYAPMPVGEALRKYYELEEASHAPTPHDPDRGP